MSIVSLVRTPGSPGLEDVEKALEKSLQFFGGLGAFMFPGARVMIKPNAGSPSGPESGVNTDPMVIEALIHLLTRAGGERIIIAESSIVGFNTQESFEATGLADVARRTGVQLMDLKQEPVEEVSLSHGLVMDRVKVFRPVLEADLLINVPKMKTITAIPVSLGMKNLKGVIPDQEKRRFHYTDLNQAIVDLNRVIKPHLTIIDGIVASELYQQKVMNILIAGTDTAAVDTVGALVMGVDPGKIKHLVMAGELGLGKTDIAQINVLGEKICDVSQNFRQASGNVDGFKQLFPQVEIAAGTVCTSCLAGLNKVLTIADREGFLEKWQGFTIAVGSGAVVEKDKRVLYLGNCLKQHQKENFIPGCPFIYLDLVQFLKENTI